MNFIFTGLLLFWAGLNIYIFFFHNRKTGTKLQERSSKYLLLFFVLTGFILALFTSEGWRELFEPFKWNGYLGTVLLLFAIVFKLLVMKQLGSSYSIDVGVISGNKLYKEGVYRYIRHPGYSADMIVFCGVALVMFTPLNSLFVLLLPIIGVVIRVGIEERFLIKHFGEEYLEYSRKTRRFIPFII